MFKGSAMEHKPINFGYACRLLKEYCQLPWASEIQKTPVMCVGRGWPYVARKLLGLNEALQTKEKSIADYEVDCIKDHFNSIPAELRTFQAHGQMYDIQTIVTYINDNLNKSTDFWDRTDDIDMNPFHSPRTSSVSGGRNTPTKRTDEIKFVLKNTARDIQSLLTRLKDV
jgi:hypothetical protein